MANRDGETVLRVSDAVPTTDDWLVAVGSSLSLAFKLGPYWSHVFDIRRNKRSKY